MSAHMAVIIRANDLSRDEGRAIAALMVAGFRPAEIMQHLDEALALSVSGDVT